MSHQGTPSVSVTIPDGTQPMYKNINSWDEVKENDIVIEDTYPEIYQVFWSGGQKWIKQIGWRTRSNDPVPDNACSRPLDFEPNCTYDQPWLVLC